MNATLPIQELRMIARRYEGTIPHVWMDVEGFAS
jgi:hypothetical protein